MKKQKAFVVLGPPGSGKGTQTKLLIKKFGLEYFGTGEALRSWQKKKDFTAKKLIKTMGRGELVPSFLITKLLINKLEEFKLKKNIKGFVIDGAPRKMVQANILDGAIRWYEWEKSFKIFYINVSKKEASGRLTKRRQCKECKRLIPWVGEFKKLKKCDKCGGELFTRLDDCLTSINKRFKEFKEHTIPVIRHYKKKGSLIDINGEQSIENVFKDILKKAN